MAHNHVQPYVSSGVPGWRVLWRLPAEHDPRKKSDHVSTQRFPIVDGITAEQAWEEAFKFASRIYGEGHFTVPRMPDIDWKALGAVGTAKKSRRQQLKENTEKAYALFAKGYDTDRVASEVGIGRSTAFRYRKAWDEGRPA